MSQIYLVDKLTSATKPEAVRALAVGARVLSGGLPTVDALACHVAQSALETGHWGSCHWWNFGNVKASTSYVGFITMFGCNEVLKGKVQWFHPSEQWGWPWRSQWILQHPTSRANDSQCRWRAYEDIDGGALAQLEFLAKRSRYAAAWRAAESGDPEAFSRALSAAGYYTASVESYTKTLVSLFRSYRPLCVSALDGLRTVEESAPIETPFGEPSQQDDERKARGLCDEWLRNLDLRVDWGEHWSSVKSAVLATNEDDEA